MQRPHTKESTFVPSNPLGEIFARNADLYLATQLHLLDSVDALTQAWLDRSREGVDAARGVMRQLVASKDVSDVLIDYYKASMPFEDAKAQVAKLDTTAKQVALEQVCLSALAGRRHTRQVATSPFMLQQPFQDADRRVERGSPARRSLAVPAAVIELLIQQAVDQPIARLAEIGAGCQDPPVDAGLGLAVEKGPAVELPPSDAVPHEADRSADGLTRRVHAQILQHPGHFRIRETSHVIGEEADA